MTDILTYRYGVYRFLKAAEVYSYLKSKLSTGSMTAITNAVDKLIVAINSKTVIFTLENGFSFVSLLDSIISNVLSSTDLWIDSSRSILADLLRKLKTTVSIQLGAKHALASSVMEVVAQQAEGIISSVYELAGTRTTYLSDQSYLSYTPTQSNLII